MNKQDELPCVADVVSFSGLSILDYPFGFFAHIYVATNSHKLLWDDSC